MHIAIVGNGITGVSAALRLRELRPDCKITMISGESDYHYSRPALMYIFMGHMGYKETKPYEDSFWGEQKIELVRGWVTEIDSSGHRLRMHDGRNLSYDKLLIATGAEPNKFGWPGQDLEGVQGFYSLMDLKKLYSNVEGASRGVIVGGGLIGIELAEMLHSRGIDVTLLVRESSYWNNVLPSEESEMVNRQILRAGMDLRLESEMKEVIDNGSGRACGVMAAKLGSDDIERIDCNVVGLTAGVHPNTALAVANGIDCERGILVDWTLKTHSEDIWSAGDCAEIENPGDERNLIQQVWYTGKAQGRLAAESMLGGAKNYELGIWFNSAKFLDLEYQTYGQVGFRLPGEEHLVWQDEDSSRLFRIVHIDGVVVGFNAMGMRWRHSVCEKWIGEKWTVEQVLGDLHDAGFDSEFCTRFDGEIASVMGSALTGARD
ncbi:MAG: FAD-dependent oxidoreductase [Planctomycetota bacterium]|nr:FAD-dependent oxidoreductase [Planctomycetota bacterium]